MLVNKGDKLIVTKDVASFLRKGDIVEVVDVEDDIIAFAFGEEFMHKGVMNTVECETHFTKYVEPKKVEPTVTEEMIEDIIKNSDIEIETVFNKCTIVTCKLPNGFIIVESSACVSPENYDEEIGFEICMNKIVNKIWELEGYKLQCELYNKNEEVECPCNCDCGDCPCSEECYEEDEEDEHIYNDNLDCNNCDNYYECLLR